MSPFGAQRAFLEAETHFALYLAGSAWAPQANKCKAQADVKDLSAQIHPSDGGSQLALCWCICTWWLPGMSVSKILVQVSEL